MRSILLIWPRSRLIVSASSDSACIIHPLWSVSKNRYVVFLVSFKARGKTRDSSYVTSQSIGSLVGAPITWCNCCIVSGFLYGAIYHLHSRSDGCCWRLIGLFSLIVVWWYVSDVKQTCNNVVGILKRKTCSGRTVLHELWVRFLFRNGTSNIRAFHLTNLFANWAVLHITD